jgi:metal-dependent hydrolase (beta-lactamase superfamily II)
VWAGRSQNPTFVAGGFHLVTAQDSAIDKTVTALHDTYKVERIAPGHCSGERAFSAVKRIFSDRYQYAGVGSVVRLEAFGRVASRAQDTTLTRVSHHPV